MSVISLISMLVIGLVVWLIVVFFSVTDGLEKSWVEKLTALTAPVRITPTDAYYHSYYYLIDTVSEASQFSPRTIQEKRLSGEDDPYNPDVDEEIPSSWPPADRFSDGSLKNLVKLVDISLAEIAPRVSGLQPQDFVFTGTHLKLHLLRRTHTVSGGNLYGSTVQSALSYPAYLGNFAGENKNLSKTLIGVQKEDLDNLLFLVAVAEKGSDFGVQNEHQSFSKEILSSRLHHFFSFVRVKELAPRSAGWNIPLPLLEDGIKWDVFAIVKDGRIVRLMVPQDKNRKADTQKMLEEQGLSILFGKLVIDKGLFSFTGADGEEKGLSYPVLTLAPGASFPVELDSSSLDEVKQVEEIAFRAEVSIQGYTLKGVVRYQGLKIADAEIVPVPLDAARPLWIYSEEAPNGSFVLRLPVDPEIGEGVALPKSFRDAGVLLGDRGTLSYFAPTASVLQEQLIPIYVAGFYDPGIIPIGGKFILGSERVTSLIASSLPLENQGSAASGINVRFDTLSQAGEVKAALQNAFKKHGIAHYWNVETYQEYEFTKEIMGELKSQKNLFLLISIVIVLVACSNIISMLIILVNDKKMEIGILRSMGATASSIASIFAIAGVTIGMFGSIVGIIAAIVTLHNLDHLIGFLSMLQGHDLFRADVYGQVLPHELSMEALFFVCIATAFLSLCAGVLPALKASCLCPSDALKSNGG